MSSVLQKGMGATAFTGVPRKVFLFSRDPEDRDKYTHVMKEERDKQVALKYKTIKVKDPKQPSGVIQVEWLGVVERDSDEMINQPNERDKSTTDEAVAIIRDMLRTGPKKKSDIDQALKENGIDIQKLQMTRVKKRCRAESRPLPGKGAGWEWYVPASEGKEV